MSRIILIETSTALCSTALVEDDRIVCYRESGELRSHASKTALFIREMVDEWGLKVSDCDAICVSKGPGSYTGLRVGVSTAKGLCFAANLPLIAIDTLETLVWQAFEEGKVPQGCKYIVPMIDARRMEVYTAVYSADKTRLCDIEPRIVDSESFRTELSEGPVLFIGDGALKCSEVLGCPNAHFLQECPKASSMIKPALKALDEKRFENTAYFEPFYLKQFVATVSKKSLF